VFGDLDAKLTTPPVRFFQMQRLCGPDLVRIDDSLVLSSLPKVSRRGETSSVPVLPFDSKGHSFHRLVSLRGGSAALLWQSDVFQTGRTER
jgi:hypothetical protein